MIELISQEFIGQCIISKKTKRLVGEVEVFESVTKGPRHWISNETELDANDHIFTELSDALDAKAITEIWCQLDLLMKSMSDSTELSDYIRHTMKLHNTNI